jgi:non-ribosomal peptide synthetase component F
MYGIKHVCRNESFARPRSASEWKRAALLWKCFTANKVMNRDEREKHPDSQPPRVRNTARHSDPGICSEAETTIPARFEEIAARQPSRIALGGDKGQATYAELNLAANRLAHTIIARAGEPKDRVAVLMRHETPLIVAALAILKAARIAVVLNPSDPPARLRQILEDAGPSLVIADAANRALAARAAGKICGVLV